MSDAQGQSGWVGWSGDSWGDLPSGTRERVRHRMIERHRARGPLAAIVHVRVYADDAEPALPDDSLGFCAVNRRMHAISPGALDGNN